MRLLDQRKTTMSFTRPFIWTCDFCGATSQKDSWGLPKGWIVLNAQMMLKLPTRHACEKCRDGALGPLQQNLILELNKPKQ